MGRFKLVGEADNCPYHITDAYSWGGSHNLLPRYPNLSCSAVVKRAGSIVMMEVHRQRGKANRRRGHDFERYVARLFRRWFPEARRGLQYQDGNNYCDVVSTPYYIECKYARKRFKYSLLSTWIKVREDEKRRHIPSPLILVIRRLAYKPIMVSMSCMGADLLGIQIKDSGSGITSCTWEVFVEAMDKKHGIRDEPDSD